VGLPVCIMVLLAEVRTLKSDKGMHKRRNIRDYNLLPGLRPPRGVAPYCWLVGVTSSMNRGHTLLLKWWPAFFAALPC
jgi:hypothetical protein